MNRALVYLLAFAGVAAGAAALGTLYAHKTAQDAALSIAQAKIGLARAVTVAEGHVGGKAMRAEYGEHQGQWVFDVAVVRGTAVMDVTVDAATGKVLAAVDSKPGIHEEQDRE